MSGGFGPVPCLRARSPVRTPLQLGGCALLHGDLHPGRRVTGPGPGRAAWGMVQGGMVYGGQGTMPCPSCSIMVDDSSAKIIDPEFTIYGAIIDPRVLEFACTLEYACSLVYTCTLVYSCPPCPVHKCTSVASNLPLSASVMMHPYIPTSLPTQGPPLAPYPVGSPLPCLSPCVRPPRAGLGESPIRAGAGSDLSQAQAWGMSAAPLGAVWSDLVAFFMFMCHM